LVIAYVPINAALTVNMAQLSGEATARWFDPTNNTYRSIAGSPFQNSGSVQFNHPGNNGDGFTDWILVLESVATPTPTATPTVTVTPTLTPAPTPTPTPTGTSTPAAINISGAVSYCSNPLPRPVPNVIFTLTGSGSGSTLSDSSGNYVFSSLASGGTYTVTPSKAARPPASSGITTVDVLATQRHYLNFGTPLSGCALAAADVNGSNGVDTSDVIGIRRFFLGLSTGIANVGKYKLIPANRSYPGLGNNQPDQNYDALIFGDVASPFAE
jgi:hypothetical protein